MVSLPGGVTATAISAGSYHSLAAGSDGNLYAWGYNGQGELGNNSNDSALPILVSLPSGITPTAISAGGEHNLAILATPTLGIGYVTKAEGNVGTTNFTFPVTLSLPSNVTVTVNYATSDGTATAPSDYTATSGTLTFSPGITTQIVTVPVTGDTVAEGDENFKVALSNPSGALLRNSIGVGTIINDDPDLVNAWGINVQGELGNGTTTNSTTPILTNLPAGVMATSIAGAQFHSLAIGSDGNLYAWGYNAQGELGNGTTTESHIPVVVGLPSGVTAIAISSKYEHSLAIGSDGKLYAWGLNSVGQLGNGTTTESHIPVVVGLPSGVTATAISAGSFSSLAIGSDSKLYTWGSNQSGQLGNGTNNNSSIPLVVKLPDGVSPLMIAAGAGHNLALGSDGKLYAWGSNSVGQLGNGTSLGSNIPVVVSLPSGITPTAIAAGDDYNMAIGNDGQLYTWGYNQFGELGDGTTTQRTTPVTVTLGSGITPTAISAGSYHSMAIGNDGKLYMWGYNTQGELGDGTTINSSIPVVTSLPSGATPIAIAAVGFHSLAIVPPVISINNVSQAEGNSGITSFVFTATLSAPLTQTVTVNYATSDGTATAPSDYTATSGTLTFSPGITTQTVTVPVIGDTSLESDETFTVTLSSPNGAALGTAQGIGTILNDDTAINLISNPNPSTFGQAVTFTATVNPITATGTVSFTFDSNTTFTTTLSGGSAAYITNTLPVGSHVVTATYSGNVNYAGSVSQPITQVVACAPLLVTSTTDDGSGTSCGTLSYALSQPITGSTAVTITFALTQGNTITFTSSLTTTVKVKAGVTIYGGAFGSTNRIILNGNGVAGDGLHLAGHNYLYNLTIKKFGGRELVLENPGTRMQGVVVDAS